MYHSLTEHSLGTLEAADEFTRKSSFPNWSKLFLLLPVTMINDALEFVCCIEFSTRYCGTTGPELPWTWTRSRCPFPLERTCTVVIRSWSYHSLMLLSAPNPPSKILLFPSFLWTLRVRCFVWLRMRMCKIEPGASICPGIAPDFTDHTWQNSKYTELNDALSPSQQGSRLTRQTHDATYALIATVQQRYQHGYASYCCFIDFATAYPSQSVHRERLGPTLKNYNINKKIWHLLKEKKFKSKTVGITLRNCARWRSRIQPMIPAPHCDEVQRGQPYPSSVSSKAPRRQPYPFRNLRCSNHEKTEAMIPEQKASRQPASLFVTTRPKQFPLKNQLLSNI